MTLTKQLSSSPSSTTPVAAVGGCGGGVGSSIMSSKQSTKLPAMKKRASYPPMLPNNSVQTQSCQHPLLTLKSEMRMNNASVRRRYSIDDSIQCTGNKRRYMRRGSRAPTMFFLSKQDIEKCINDSTNDEDVSDFSFGINSITANATNDNNSAVTNDNSNNNSSSCEFGNQSYSCAVDLTETTTSTSRTLSNSSIGGLLEECSGLLEECNSAPIKEVKRISLTTAIFRQFEELAINTRRKRKSNVVKESNVQSMDIA